MESFVLGDTIQLRCMEQWLHITEHQCVQHEVATVFAPVVRETVKFGCQFVSALSSQFNELSQICLAWPYKSGILGVARNKMLQPKLYSKYDNPIGVEDFDPIPWPFWQCFIRVYRFMGAKKMRYPSRWRWAITIIVDPKIGPLGAMKRCTLSRWPVTTVDSHS